MRRSDERACDLAFDLESRELRQCPPIHCSVWTSGETGELWSRSCSVCRVCWLYEWCRRLVKFESKE